MALTDFTYIATIGNACAPFAQLKRISQSLGLHPTRYVGPFDWMIATLDQVIGLSQSNFASYFAPNTATLTGPHVSHWIVRDASGVISLHHLRSAKGDAEPAAAWFDFGKWVGSRVQLWESN